LSIRCPCEEFWSDGIDADDPYEAEAYFVSRPSLLTFLFSFGKTHTPHFLLFNPSTPRYEISQNYPIHTFALTQTCCHVFSFPLTRQKQMPRSSVVGLYQLAPRLLPSFVAVSPPLVCFLRCPRTYAFTQSQVTFYKTFRFASSPREKRSSPLVETHCFLYYDLMQNETLRRLGSCQEAPLFLCTLFLRIAESQSPYL